MKSSKKENRYSIVKEQNPPYLGLTASVLLCYSHLNHLPPYLTPTLKSYPFPDAVGVGFEAVWSGFECIYQQYRYTAPRRR